MKKKTVSKQVDCTLLTFKQRRIINYLIGKQTINENGFCFIGKQDFTRRYLAVEKLAQKGIVKILSAKNNLAEFRFTRPYCKMRKISVSTGEPIKYKH